MTPAPTSSTAPRRSRIALFDNIKGFLIALVVLGHMMHPVHNDNPVLSGIFDVIYLFHMPLFILVSGLFAKSTYRDGRLNVNRIISFFVLGVAFQVALLLINGDTLTLPRILRFPSAPWYLIAMAWWSALTPALSMLGAKRGMVISVTLSLGIGYIDLEGGLFALSRTIAFLPWFALGYYITSDDLIRIKASGHLWIAVFLSSLFIFARILEPDAYSFFFSMVFGDNPYEDGGINGIFSKIIASIVALIFSLTILKLMPSGRCMLTTLGRRTFQVYILHRLIRAALTFRTPFYEMPMLLEPITGTVIIFFITTAVLAITALPCLEAPFNGLLSTNWTQLLRKVSAKTQK